MQKYCLILFFFVVATISMLAQKSEVIVKGTVEFPVEGVDIKISQVLNKEKILIDSISVNSDKTFEKTIQLPAPGLYEIDCQKWEKLSFWGENEDIEINFRGEDTARVKIMIPPYRHIESAGENNELMNLVRYSDYRTYQAGIRAIRELNSARKSDCKEWEGTVANGYRQANDAGNDNIDHLVKYYHDRNSVMALLPRIKSEKIKEEMLDYFETYKSDYAPYAKYKQEIADIETKLKKVAPGVSAPDFSYIFKDDKKGDSLKEYRGKYLLIDFWASWCGPCRKSIPALKELYEKYVLKDFKIISVSIDSEKNNWLKALEEENMPWPQLFTEDVGKEVMNYYQFGYIPFLVLIDKEGKIVERGISLNKVKDVLGEVL